MHAIETSRALLIQTAFPYKTDSETEQPAPPLAERINDQSAQEQPHRDPDGDLNHAVGDVQDVAVDIDTRRVGRVADGRRSIRRGAVNRLFRELVRRRQPADQTAPGRETRRYLHEDGGE